MNRKWCLLKRSDGARGAAGKKKIYEISVAQRGDYYQVVCEWGMAEKPARQTSVHTFRTGQAALFFAYEKLGSKTASGYDVAYSV